MSSTTISKVDEASKQIAVISTANSDVSTKHRKIKVLDEDTYIQNVEKIITRDFFPDLEKLQAQAEYIEAVERKDTEKIWELRRRFSTQRVHTGGRTSPTHRWATPATFETPNEPVKQTPTAAAAVGSPSSAATGAETAAAGDDDNTAAAEQSGEGQAERKREGPTHNPEPEDPLRNVGLDAFFARNTSEDNVSFAEIMNESEKRKRLKNSWLYEAEENGKQEQLDNLALPSIEDQASSSTSKQLQTWTYKSKNAVMYPPEGVALSESEIIEGSSRKPREVIHKNTRFTVDPFNEHQNRQTLTQAASSQAVMLHGKIGADGREILPTNTPRVRGYGFIATPSPAPGVDASPLMTWGEIEGTPFSLDPTETPLIHRTPGPTFKVPEVPRRDRLMLALTEKHSKYHRAKKQEAIKQCQASFSRTSSPATPKADRLAFLSPAAQRLAKKKFGVKPSSDKALRDFYTPSPTRKTPGGSTRSTPNISPANSTTPSHKTPGHGSKTPSHKTPGNKTPASNTTPKQRTSLTDDLLQLPVRPRAQDLF